MSKRVYYAGTPKPTPPPLPPEPPPEIREYVEQKAVEVRPLDDLLTSTFDPPWVKEAVNQQRIIIEALYEDGHYSTQVDLEDVIRWACKNQRSMVEHLLAVTEQE